MKILIILMVVILIMPHGAPDYSNVQKNNEIYRLDDLGELAVRMGSPIRYDRRGDVLWFTDFEDGLLGFDYSEVGTLSDLVLLTTPVDTPPFAVDLHTGTTNPSSVTIVKNMSKPMSKRVGVSTLVYPSLGARSYRIDIYDYYITYVYWARLIYRPDERKLYYQAEDGSFPELATGLADYITSGVFVNIKLVVDGDKNEYVRTIFGDTVYDMSGLGIRRITGTYTDKLEVDIQHYTTTGVAASLYMDTIVITINEP